MLNESTFRLFSLAAFGLIVAACTANQQATPSPSVASLSAPSTRSIQLEMDAIEETHAINSGHFKPYELDTSSNDEAETLRF